MKALLDDIDWHILAELQGDGRMTNVELARRVGISAPPCLRRVRALEEAGLIRGYRALLDEKALGYDVVAYAMVGLVNQSESDLVAFEARVAGWSMVRECYAISGDVDFILKCAAQRLFRLPGLHHRRADQGRQRLDRAHRSDPSPGEGCRCRADRMTA
jgi:DNA-binding Lrp family transcriptional regulator